MNAHDTFILRSTGWERATVLNFPSRPGAKRLPQSRAELARLDGPWILEDLTAVTLLGDVRIRGRMLIERQPGVRIHRRIGFC